MATLSELLPVEAIRLDVPAEDWREAVRAAGDLMEATGTTTGGYTDQMIETVEQSGPYIVIAPGLAFAHARPGPTVLRAGMSWVRLERPVEFGHDTNDPVHLVVGLAATEASEHQAAMAALARLLGDPETERALSEAPSPPAVHALLSGEPEPKVPGAERPARPSQPVPESAAPSGQPAGAARPEAADTAGAGRREAASGAREQHKILTVCGNGLGTSLFLKNTLEQVLSHWGWSPYVTVEATDTISAKGKAGEAVAILTSREIARTLGEVGVPVKVVENFTSAVEVDRTLRDTYDV